MSNLNFLEIANNPRKLAGFSSRLFRTLDVDRSKLLELDEFAKFVDKIGQTYKTPYIPSKDEVEKYFNKLDKDNSGQLDEDEFKKFIKMILIEIDSIKNQK